MAFTIGNALGISDNPLYKTLGSKRNALMGFGAGLASGTNFGQGIANALQGAATGAIRDDAYALMEEEKATQLAQSNKTAEWLQSQGYTDLLPLVEAGQGSAALSEAFKRMQPGYGAGPEPTANMRDFQFAQENPEYAQFLGGGTEAPQIETRFNPDTGQEEKVQWSPSQGWVPFGGQKMPSARDMPMNATIQKEIFDADEAVQAGQSVVNALNQALVLNDQAWTGPAADWGSGLASLTGDQGAIATQDLKNLVTSQALDNLKAIFGGMPTEGERKILLEIQGSVNQSPENRRRIYERAIAAANRRIAANQAKADGLRSGSYFDAGYVPGQAQQPNTGTTSTGLSWSVSQ